MNSDRDETRDWSCRHPMGGTRFDPTRQTCIIGRSAREADWPLFSKTDITFDLPLDCLHTGDIGKLTQKFCVKRSAQSYHEKVSIHVQTSNASVQFCMKTIVFGATSHLGELGVFQNSPFRQVGCLAWLGLFVQWVCMFWRLEFRDRLIFRGPK